MNDKKNILRSTLAAIVVGLAVMLYLILGKGRTDNGVFLIGGIAAGAAALILPLPFGRKGTQNPVPQESASSGMSPAEREEARKRSDQAEALEALKHYDRSAIDRIDDPEVLYQVATIDFGLEEILHSFYSDPAEGKGRFAPDLEDLWAKQTERIMIRRDNAIKAIERLEDKELLEKIVRLAGPFAADAAEKLSSLYPESASALARDESLAPAVRKAAIRALTDQEEVKELYRQTAEEDLRLLLIAQLSDQQFLTEIAEHPESKEAGRAAAEKVTDPDSRKRYCQKYGTHDWVFDHEERTECGDYLDIDDVCVCRFCGQTTRKEHERIRL